MWEKYNRNTRFEKYKFVSKMSAHDPLLRPETPGGFATTESLETTCMKISHCVITSHPGPHAIFLVLQFDHYVEKEQKTIP